MILRQFKDHKNKEQFVYSDIVENKMCFRLKLCLCLFFSWNINVLVKSNFTTVRYDETYNSNDSSVSDETSENTEISKESTENITNLSVGLRLPTECGTPNGDPGWCIEIQQCPKLLKQLTNKDATSFLVASKCGPKNEDFQTPRVCCGKYDNFRQVSNYTVDDITIFPKKCGQQKMFLRSRIIGGTKASLGEFPWMARLIHKNVNGFKSVGCSAFLIHTKYVLTAAHCVHESFIKFRGPAFSVILGEHNTETKVDCNPQGTYCADPLQISRVAKVIVHPGYDVESSGHYNDIALIHLKKGARITEFVHPICLQTDQGHGQVPDNYIISGWGKTEEELFSKIKMKVDVLPVNKANCREKYGTVNINLSDSQICAGGEDQKDSCSGDSGGPLMFDNGTNWLAVGIVSYGIGCGVEGWPGVYTNVPSFMPWIKEQIIKNSLVSTRNPKPKKLHKKKNGTNEEQVN